MLPVRKFENKFWVKDIATEIFVIFLFALCLDGVLQQRQERGID
jgi:hypothetical protein